MSNKGYMAFMPDWREYKKDLTPEQWYELEDYMFQLRFDNIDTDPSSIQDKEIRLVWRSIRPQLKKIIRNYNYKQKSKNNQDIQPNTEFEITPNEPVKTEEYPNPQPKIESPSEGQEMGKNEVTETKNETVRETVEKLDWMMDVDEVEYKPIDLEKHPELDFLREDDEPQEKEQEKEKWMEKFEGVIYGSVEYYKLLNSIIEEYPSITRDSMIRKVENHYKSIEAA